VWTENVKKGLEVSKRLNCGTVWLNAHMLLEYSAPFGGWKQSGLGRELGKPGLDEFLQYKTTYWKK
jgi:aldehyde dehydrogenase (NAD+)